MGSLPAGTLPPHPVQLTLFVAPGSRACEAAHAVLAQIVAGLDPALVRFEVCDVSEDPARAHEAGIVWTPTLIVERRAKRRVTIVGALGDERQTLFRLNRAGVPLVRGVSALPLPRAGIGRLDPNDLAPREGGQSRRAGPRNPIARIQAAHSFGHCESAGSSGASPTPWRPCGNTCSSAGTPALCSASKKARLFSTGTPGSSAVWKRNAGGVRAVTCVSFESWASSAGSGDSPSSMRRDPVCVKGAVKDITG